MRKLFFSVMALAIGAFAFVSCNKDDDKNEKNGGQGGQDSFLPYEQQQRIIEQTVGGLAQNIDFSGLAGSVSTIINSIYKVEGRDIDWKAGIEAAAAQDAMMARKIGAIKQMIESDDIDLKNLNALYFEADVEFVETVVVDSTLYLMYGGRSEDLLSSDTVLIPVLKNVNHNADRFKLNFKTTDNHVLSVTLKGSSDKDARFTWLDIRKNETKNVNLPNAIDLSVTLDGQNLLSGDASLDTDFNVVLSGYYDKNSENDTVFKVSDASVYGQNLSFNANVAIDKYAVTANAVYRANTGLNVAAKALMEGKEALSVNVNVDATLTEQINWADYASILSWCMDYNKVRGLSADAAIGGDQIKVVAALKENPVKYQEVLSTAMMIVGGSTPEPEAVKAMIDKFNEIFVGEVYFKGYDKPQAKLRLVYEAPEGTKGEGSSMLSSITEAIAKSGLRILVDTYDADGNEVTITVNEYFGKINLQGALATVVSNFKQAFGPLMELIDRHDAQQDDTAKPIWVSGGED